MKFLQSAIVLLSATNRARGSLLRNPEQFPDLEVLLLSEISPKSLSNWRGAPSSAVLEQVDAVLNEGLSGKIKLMTSGFTNSAEQCYYPPSRSFHDSDVFSATATDLIGLMQSHLHDKPVAKSSTGLQAALLAITDKTHVGFSPITSESITRIVAIGTSQRADFLKTPGSSKMKGDGTDTCASGAPDASVVAKVLTDNRIFVVVLATDAATAGEWKTYGAGLSGKEAELWNVITLPGAMSTDPSKARSEALKLIAQPDVKRFLLILKGRFAANKQGFPDLLDYFTTPAPPSNRDSSAIRALAALPIAMVALALASI